MQYWINHNGVQSGPMELDALKEMGLTSSAYVWHEGLADWKKITEFPELQGFYDMGMARPEPAQPAAVQGEPLEAEIQAPAGPETTASVPVQPQQPHVQPSYPQYANQQPQNAEPCPPTNLVWAIISTVLCCLPAGIVAIVYATKVTNKYRAGDIEGAKRASEIGAWWCIAAIILGIICQPFISWLQVLALAD